MGAGLHQGLQLVRLLPDLLLGFMFPVGWTHRNPYRGLPAASLLLLSRSAQRSWWTLHDVSCKPLSAALQASPAW